MLVKASLEVAWDSRVPWPRYPRELSFGILGFTHFVLAGIMDSRPQFRACERE